MLQPVVGPQPELCRYPSALCISVNENVVHGFPGEYELKDGDIVSVDCGVFCMGFIVMPHILIL